MIDYVYRGNTRTCTMMLKAFRTAHAYSSHTTYSERKRHGL